jgi:hypothetical protein
VLVLLLTGCTQVIHDARPHAASPAAPITQGQVSDLLSDEVHEENQKRKDENVDDEDNLFVTVKPERCAGLIQEVDPPFLFDTTPAAHDGGGWLYEDANGYFSTWEMVAVYPADYDPTAALEAARGTIESCQNDTLWANAMNRAEKSFHVEPRPQPEAPEIVLWSIAGSWACDNALIAAHNAAVEITTCGETNGNDDVLSLAQDALERIEALADMRA